MSRIVEAWVLTDRETHVFHDMDKFNQFLLERPKEITGLLISKHMTVAEYERLQSELGR